jgi:predicted dehydrogenase
VSDDSQRRVGVAVVGTGYWGVNYVRVLARDPGFELRWICDPDPRARERASAIAPVRTCTDIATVLDDPGVEAVIVVTPAPTHAELACTVLAAKRHVLVEKPVALSVAAAERVAAAARTAGRHLLVGHLMVFHPVVARLRAMLRSGELGRLHYLHARRVNLGRLRRDENALWSFGPHDLSMIDHLLGEAPVSVTARGQAYLQPGIEDVVFLTLRFPGGVMANVHLSWLDPRKERRLTVVCSEKMVEFDDVAAEKLRVYDRGFRPSPEFTQFDQYLTIRDGDIHVPHVAMEEPLRVMVHHFGECVRGRATPLADGESGIRIVRTLAAAQASLAADGTPIPTGPGGASLLASTKFP